MSRDDEIDYRQMYPIGGRNRKRRAANPRLSTPTRGQTSGGFFSNELKSLSTKDITKKVRKPGRIRKKRSSRPRRSKDHELAAINSLLRIEARKMKRQKQISKPSSDPDARPSKSLLKATRELLWDYPEISVHQLRRMLERRGYEAAPITIGSIRKEFMAIIRIGEERGYVKGA